MFKRIALFFALNFVIVLTISTLLSLLNIGPYLTHYGLNLYSLSIFCLIWGMMGSLIALVFSRQIAKWTFSLKIIDPRQETNPAFTQIYHTVVKLTQKIGLLEVPQVAIFHSPQANAFATGPSKRSSLIALSTGLLENLTQEEIEAVIGHELAHISNGDMVTMSLLQGLVNAFVMFLARIAAFFVSGLLKDQKKQASSTTFYLFTILFEIVFMMGGALILAGFSRFREYRADKGSAEILGAGPMIAALTRLKSLEAEGSYKKDPRLEEAAAIMIARPKKTFALFSTHPSVEKRIAKLKELSTSIRYS